MTTRIDEAKATILDAAVAWARAQAGADADDVERWIRSYYAHVPPEDLGARTVEELGGAALAHWSLMQRRRPGELKVRVYNPTLEEHGWASPHTVIEFVNDDMPFLVDSISMEINRHGSGIHLMIRPIVRVRRDEHGDLEELVEDGGKAESTIHVELDRQTDPQALAELHDDLVRVLGDVADAVTDWPKMLEETRAIVESFQQRPPPVDREELSETIDLLEWMRENFTFLGYREYEIAEEDREEVLRAVPDSGLGILRQKGGPPISASFARLPPDVRRMARHKHLLNLTKANSRATVHRPAFLDYIGVKRFDEHGEVVAERRFLGLYTHTAYSATPWEIPVIRRKARRVLERAGLPYGGRDYKALVDIIETYPRDELLQISEDDLYEIAMEIFNLGERRRVRLFVRRDNFGRFLSCLVYIPRDRFNTRNRERIEAILDEELRGETLDYGTRVTESVLARLHYVIHVDPSDPPVWDVGGIEAKLADATREWSDDLRDELIAQLGEERASVLAHGYTDAFPIAYQEDFRATQAVLDIERIERLDPAGDLSLSLYLPHASPDDDLAFKLVRSGQPLLLSDVLPLLENMGVTVTNERPYEIRRRDYPPVWIYDFGLRRDEGEDLPPDQARELFEDAFARAWRGEIENDGFNKLVLSAGLSAREIIVLRAVAKYLRQTGMPFSYQYMEETLAGHPEIAAKLVQLFRVRLDPLRQDHESGDLDRSIVKAIDAVASLDEDRILRGVLKVIRAVLRTNWFQTDVDGNTKPYLSLKLDSKLVPDLPEPRPLVEVFVYSPRVEAIHLRGGRVARGGIRWSDRREDFRTEVLGLMKAQTVKNAVIVPVGAKGGFVVQRLPADREQQKAEVVACYRTFMSGLLDVTDTIAGGVVVPPPDVVRHDGDDPYLVVAADKGTAKFSDIANDLAGEYGFWLGDAFASGGSAGYDHKEMGITARRVGVGEAPLPRPRRRRGHGRDLRGGHRGHVGRRVRQRDAALAASQARGSLRPPAHLRRPGSGSRGKLHRAAAALPAAGLVVGRLQPEPALARRRCVPAEREVDRAVGAGAPGARHRGGDADAERTDPRDSEGPGRPALERRRRHVRQGEGGAARRRRRQGERRGPCRRPRPAHTRRRRGWQPRLHPARAGRLRVARRPHLHGRDRQLRRRRLLRPRGEPQDPARRDHRRGRPDDGGAERAARRGRGRGRRAGAARQLRPGAGDRHLGRAGGSMLEVHERYIRQLEQNRLNRELEALPTVEALEERKGEDGGLAPPEFAILLSYTKIGLEEDLLGSALPTRAALTAELEGYFPTQLRERFGEGMRDIRCGGRSSSRRS